MQASKMFPYQGFKNTFSQHELDRIIIEYPNHTIKELSSMLGRSIESIVTVLQVLRSKGLVHRKKTMNKTAICLSKLVTLLPTQLAYLAGIVDGEGTISIASTANSHRLRPFIEITNTDPLLIEWLHQFFWQDIQKATNSRGIPYLKVHLTGYGITPILERLEPYLIAKRLQCQLLRRFIELRLQQRWKDTPSDEMKQLVFDIHSLNSRKGSSLQSKQETRAKYRGKLP